MFTHKLRLFLFSSGGVLATGTFLKFFKTSDDRSSRLVLSENGKRRLLLDGYELKLVQILVRHGARTPIHTIKSIPEVIIYIFRHILIIILIKNILL